MTLHANSWAYRSGQQRAVHERAAIRESGAGRRGWACKLAEKREEISGPVLRKLLHAIVLQSRWWEGVTLVI